MFKFTENPLYLVMNPEHLESIEKKKLPFFLYEFNNNMQIPAPGSQNQSFLRLEYSLATSDSERIAVDHVSKAIDPKAKTSALSQNLQSTLNAI